MIPKSPKKSEVRYDPPLILEAIEDIHEDGKTIVRTGAKLYAFVDITPDDPNDPMNFLAGQFMMVATNPDDSGEHIYIAKSQVKEIGTLPKK